MSVYTEAVDETFLWKFYANVERLWKSNEQFRSDGVMKVILSDDARKGGSSLNDFIPKYWGESAPHINWQTLVRHRHSKGLYGFVRFTEEEVLSNDSNSFHRLEPPMVNMGGCELAHTYKDLIMNPDYYSQETCCLKELAEGGEEALLEHYFNDELSHLSTSVEVPHRTTMKEAMRRAKKPQKLLESLNDKVESLVRPEDKANVMLQSLKSLSLKEGVEECDCGACTFDDTHITEKTKFIPYAAGVEVEAEKPNYMTKNFSMSFLCSLGMLSLLENYYPGVSLPFLYFGFVHSFFTVHIEDLSLFSFNYLHAGKPKVWVVIPPTAVALLDYHLSKTEVSAWHLNCRGVLSHKYHIPTIEWLKKRRIPYKVVIQHAGEGIILCPNAAHFGFNTGANVAEAFNFATQDWIPYGITSPSSSKEGNQKSVHADLTPIICARAPELLVFYRNNKVPPTPGNPTFQREILQTMWSHPSLLDGGNVNDDLDSPTEGESGDIVGKDCTKRRQNYKKMECCLCGKSFGGGHKQRYLAHISVFHANLDHDEKSQLERSHDRMFPKRVDYLPKRRCRLCYKKIAGSMNRHQSSAGCIPKVISDCDGDAKRSLSFKATCTDSSSGDEGTQSDTDESISSYAAIRSKNIAENRKCLEKLGVKYLDKGSSSLVQYDIEKSDEESSISEPSLSSSSGSECESPVRSKKKKADSASSLLKSSSCPSSTVSSKGSKGSSNRQNIVPTTKSSNYLKTPVGSSSAASRAVTTKPTTPATPASSTAPSSPFIPANTNSH